MITDAKTWAAIVSATVAVLTLGGKILYSAYKSFQGNRLQRRIGADVYDAEAIDRAVRYYVEPNCTSVDPAQEAEPKALVVAEEPVFRVLDRFLLKGSDGRHLVVLGDSGTGKSSLLLSYFARNQRRGRNKHRIALVHLGLRDADDRINAIPEKGNVVIFVDAFDEDTKANADYRARIAELIQMTSEFRRVVLTSRTQFFLTDEEIPQDTGLLKIGARGMERGTYEFRKLYLAPFSEAMVKKYLRKRYPGMLHRTRQKALRLVRKVPSLSVRPMLLTYLPDLIDSHRPFQTSFEVYEELVSKWYLRESPWANPIALGEFSSRLACDLFLHRSTRKTERIAGRELGPLSEEWGIHLGDWQLRGRSLLNRDAAGNYKFAHRSIMEFLIAETLIKLIKGSESEQCRALRRYLTPASLPSLRSLGLPDASADALLPARGVIRASESTELTDQTRAFVREAIVAGRISDDQIEMDANEVEAHFQELRADLRALILSTNTAVPVAKIENLLVPPLFTMALFAHGDGDNVLSLYDSNSHLHWIAREPIFHISAGRIYAGVAETLLSEGYSRPSGDQKFTLATRSQFDIISDLLRSGSFGNRQFGEMQRIGRELDDSKLMNQVVKSLLHESRSFTDVLVCRKPWESASETLQRLPYKWTSY